MGLSKYERIMQLVSDLPQLDQARIAGEILDGTPMDLECFEAFWSGIGDTNKGELASRVADAGE